MFTSMISQTRFRIIDKAMKNNNIEAEVEVEVDRKLEDAEKEVSFQDWYYNTSLKSFIGFKKSRCKNCDFRCGKQVNL